MKTKAKLIKEIERDLEIAKRNYEFVEAINDKLWEIIEDKDMKIAELENENAELESMRNSHRVKVKKVKGKRCLKIIVRGNDDDR